jgi:hypothetical protein
MGVGFLRLGLFLLSSIERLETGKTLPYPLLLSQITSDGFQNVPFCNTERGLQGHTLLVTATPTPPQSYLPSSHPVPSLLQFKICVTPVKISFCWSQVRRETENKNWTFRGFENPSWYGSRNRRKVLLYHLLIFCTGQNLNDTWKPRLVHFLYTGNLGSIFFNFFSFSQKTQSRVSKTLQTQRFKIYQNLW